MIPTVSDGKMFQCFSVPLINKDASSNFSLREMSVKNL